MVHGGQFALLKEKIVLEDYQYLELKDGWILSYHKKLPVFYASERDTLLLGYVWQAEPGMPAPYEQIRNARSPEEVLAAEESWCGRYVLMIGSKICLDASGLFGVFYCAEGASSDLSFLTKVKGLKISEWRPDDIMRWFPGPDTPYTGIRRLLPSQIYDYDARTTEFRYILSRDTGTFDSEEKLMDAFIDLFISSLKNLQKTFPDRKLLLALTGGYDSRTLLALSAKAGIPFDCYTLEHDNMPLGDIQYPPELCKLVGASYTYYKRDQGTYSAQKESDYFTHLCMLQREQDRTFYAYSQYESMAQNYGNVALLRSGVWEIAQEYDRRAVQTKAELESVLNYYELPLNSMEADAFRAFYEWCDAHPLPVSDTNRFFWEQRCGSWIAESEHGFDIYDTIISLQPVNCRKLITMLLQFPLEDRMTKHHQEKIVLKLFPDTRTIPYGKNEVFTTSKFLVIKKKAGKVFRRIHKIGLRRTIKMYKLIRQDQEKTKQLNMIQKKDTQSR